MNVLDIIIIVILIWAVVSGLRQGIIAQACGLAGIILGAWLAFSFCSKLGEWIGFELSDIAAFAILFVVAILVMLLIGRLAKGILKTTGLGFIDRLGGAILSVAEYALVVGLLLGFFKGINERVRIVEPEKIEQSVLAKPVETFSKWVFPYILKAKDAIIDSVGHDEAETETQTPANTQKI